MLSKAGTMRCIQNAKNKFTILWVFFFLHYSKIALWLFNKNLFFTCVCQAWIL